MNNPFSIELEFTETYQRHLNDDPAIREAHCLRYYRHFSILCWLLQLSARMCEVKRMKGGVSCYCAIISPPNQEQTDGQIPFLASKTDQALDQTCDSNANLQSLSDLPRSRTDLMVENAFLHQQLIVLNRQIKRPQLTNPDRLCLVFLTRFTVFWKQALHIVQPDTLLRWHREMFHFY